MKTVILIDDEAGVVLALKLLLQTLGYKVEAFTEPQKALDFLAGADSDFGNSFVLSDLRMPVLSGFDVLQTCRDKYPALPVVIMSGHAEEDEISKAMSLGAKSFLSKPFTPQDLVKSIG